MKTMRQQIFFKMLSLQLKKHNGLKWIALDLISTEFGL